MNTSTVNIFVHKLYRAAYRKISAAIDFLLLKLHLPCLPASQRITGQNPKIVFFTDGMVPRISRMAKWIKRDGRYSIILIASKIGYFEKFSNDDWDGVFLYRNGYHLERILKQIQGVYLYHAFAPKSYYPDLVRKTVKEPFFIDMQDVYACYYGLNPGIRWIKAELPCEKNCLQLSSGVIGQSLEPNVALRSYGKSKPPSLFFPLYCDNDYLLPNRKRLDIDDLHVVYAGGVAGSHRDKAQYGMIQFHDLIRVLSAQKVHFHIYPSPSNFRADYQEYAQISKQNDYFHFHQSVSQDQLASELNKYHFGLLPFFKINSGQSAEKFKFATTLKLFNYIEAGIPVLVSEDLVYQNWIINRYDAGLTIREADIPRLKEMISSLDYPAMVTLMIRKRENISIKMHIPRLFDFYRSVTGEA